MTEPIILAASVAALVTIAIHLVLLRLSEPKPITPAGTERRAQEEREWLRAEGEADDAIRSLKSAGCHVSLHDVLRLKHEAYRRAYIRSTSR